MESSPNLNNTKSSCNSCPSAVATASNAIELAAERPRGEYRKFSDAAFSDMYLNRIPSTGSIEITENCNFRCIHCYQGMNKAKHRLSGEKWISIIDELEKEGTFWLLITGGEPLLHPDFEKIYTHAYKKGIIVTVFTNARLFKDEHLELFKKYPPFSLEVTLYGASEQMYQTVTGTKGSFELVRNNVKRMKDAGLNLKLKSVAFQPLAQDIPALKKYAEEEIGVMFRFDTKIDPGIYGDNFDHLRLTPEEAVLLEEKLVGHDNLAKDMKALLSFNTQAVKNNNTKELLYRCGAGKNGYYIDYKGWVHTCSTGRLEEEQYDLNKMSFSEIWWVHLPKVVFQKRRELNTVCMKCEFKGICDACPATAKLATGSKEGRPMYICQHTMERKRKFLFNKGIINQGVSHEAEKNI